MARSGGTFTKAVVDFVFDTVISETDMNTLIDDIGDEITNSVAVDGQSTMTGALQMGNQRITGLAVGTAVGDGLTLAQAQAGAMNYVASDTGSADAYAIAPSPAVAAYAAGQVFWFIAANNSTGASTLAVSGLATKAIQIAGSAISGASITTGGVTGVIYDGTQFQLLTEDATVGGVPTTITIADESADTTCFPLFVTAATGNLAPKTGSNITFNSNTGELGATILNATSIAAASLTGAITGADNTVSAINLKDYGEVTNALGAVSGATAIDLNAGNSVTISDVTGTLTLSFTNPTSSDEMCGFTLGIKNGGDETINFPASVDWAGGSAPTLSGTGGSTDWMVFWTVNGGTLWSGGLVGAAFA